MRRSIVLGLTSALAVMALAVLPSPSLVSSAHAQEPVKPQEPFKYATDLEALTRAVEKVDPRIVREIKDRLARIDSSNLTDDQKKTEKIKYFFERQEYIEKITKAARDSGIATEQGLDDLRLIRDYVRVQFFIEVNHNPVENALAILSYSSRTALQSRPPGNRCRASP